MDTRSIYIKHMKWTFGNMDQKSFKNIKGLFESLKSRNQDVKKQKNCWFSSKGIPPPLYRSPPPGSPPGKYLWIVNLRKALNFNVFNFIFIYDIVWKSAACSVCLRFPINSHWALQRFQFPNYARNYATETPVLQTRENNQINSLWLEICGKLDNLFVAWFHCHSRYEL